MKALSAIVVAIGMVGSIASECKADDIGRYQAIMFPKADSLGNSVFILDTKDGNLWRWWENPTMGKSPGSRGIIYLGKVVLGTEPGQVIQSQSFRIPQQ